MITRWAPSGHARSVERFNKMMEYFFGETNGDFRGAWIPTVDVKETPKDLSFTVELPGMEEKDIQVEMDANVLTIRGERQFSQEEKKEDYVRMERSYGTFQRSFTIDVPVKAEKIQAQYKCGLLTVTLPKTEGAARKKIEVKTG
jgi:HSP20 family protein